MTLVFGSATDAQTPNLGVSGAIAAVWAPSSVSPPARASPPGRSSSSCGSRRGSILAGGSSTSSSRPTSGYSEQRERRRCDVLAHVGGFVFGYVVARCSPERGGSPPGWHRLPGLPTDRQDRDGTAGRRAARTRPPRRRARAAGSPASRSGLRRRGFVRNQHLPWAP